MPPAQHPYRTLLLLTGLLVLALLLGGVIGYMVALQWRSVQPLTIREDTRTKIPVVQINGMSNGTIRGVVTGDVRVFIGDSVVVPTGTGSFQVPVPKGFAQQAVAQIQAPAGMQFVASSRGKKYYPLNDPSAAKLAPQNRIYFRDAESAVKAGYRR